MGVIGLLKPSGVFSIYDSDIGSVGGRSEIRAVYGGLCLFFGLLCSSVAVNFPLSKVIPGRIGQALDGRDVKKGVHLTMLVVLAGCAFGRVVSIVADGAWPGAYAGTFFAFEVVSTLWLAYAF